MDKKSINFIYYLIKNILKNMTNKKQITRNLTSIALMVIMVAGGMTVAFPGFDPTNTAYADHNANLFVSAEDTNNFISGVQVVEVVIIDDDINGTPDVTINGDTLVMTKTNDGNHYGYFVSSDVVNETLGSGLNYGTECTNADEINSEANTVLCKNDDTNVLKSARTSTNTDFPFIQVFDFSRSVEIEYNRSGGIERTELAIESDEDISLTLDREVYPLNAQVHATITDHRFNIDPTSDDVWTWNVDSSNTALYYGLDTFDKTDDTELLENYAVNTDIVCDGCAFTIDTDAQNRGSPVLQTNEGVNNRPINFNLDSATDILDGIWVTIRENNGPNTGIFTTTDLDDNSVLSTTSDAQRDTSATIEYDGVAKSVVIKYDTARISFDIDGKWTSGLPIPIIVIDNDANKNSLADEILLVDDYKSIIPTLQTGNPFTLDNTGEELTTWIAYSITDSDISTEFTQNVELERLLGTYDNHRNSVVNSLDVLVFTNTNIDPFEFRGVDLRADSAISNGDSLVVFENTASVERFSERALLSFNDPTTNDLVLTSFRSLVDDTTSELLVDFGHLVIDMPDGLEKLQRSIIDDRSERSHGVNLINWNVESLGKDVSLTNIVVMAGGDMITSIDVTDDSYGYELISDDAINAIVDTESEGMLQLRLDLTGTNVNTNDTYPIVLDVFSFGFYNDGDASSERIANQIVRLELEEKEPSSFEGTLEFVMINQLNILDETTYTDLKTVSKDAKFIVIEDLTGSNAPSVTYLDVSSDGVEKQVSAQEDAPSHTGVVVLDVVTFKVADSVKVILDDLDLNVQSDLIDIYTVVNINNDPNTDIVGIAGSEHDNLGKLLEITFDDEIWKRSTNTECVGEMDGHNGLGATGFSLVETTIDSGIFEGTFKVPAELCQGNSDTPVSTTGLDLAVNYIDFRDASGETTEVGHGAGIKATTGSIAFEKTVYPVPFGNDIDGESKFPHPHGIIPNGDLIVYIRIIDPDFDVSASGNDAIALEDEPVTVTINRGSALPREVIKIGGVDSPITEIAPDAGVFEASVTIRYDDGPSDSGCPRGGETDPLNNGNAYCILQGDILQVEYEDPTDSSGEPNTVTDSATFDLRNGVLQSDKSVYIIGSEMILTLIEPDLNLDTKQDETYPLDLIEWDSDSAKITLGHGGGSAGAFDPRPFSLRETGPNTGIFQVIIEIPEELDDEQLERGEEIELTYTDWGPSGSEYVGDDDEEIELTVFTSNFGASIELNKKIYTWTDKIYITVVAPDHNFDNQLIDEIGDGDNDDTLRVSTRENRLDNYRLVETGTDTGIFTGEVILTGFTHDPVGYTLDKTRQSTGSGPTDGLLETEQNGGISVSYEFSDDETVLTSSLIRWNIGEVQWLEPSYPASGNGILRIIDPDRSLNPEAVDSFDVNLVSTTDAGGISLTVNETNEATGIFEGTVFFTTTDASSGHRLRVTEGDTVTVIYDDSTLPSPYTTADNIPISATTLIGTIVPPLERAPISNLRVVDPFGDSIDGVNLNQQVQVSTDLINSQDREQPFAYLVQIQNSDGITTSLAWISGALSPLQSVTPAVSWSPIHADTYTITAFVWESIDNPNALSPPLTITVNVG